VEARAAVLRALQALPRGEGPGALRALAPLLEEALADEVSAGVLLHEELVRVLGAVMAEDTPTTLEDAAALATGVDAALLETELPRLREALDGLKRVEGTGEPPVEALARAEQVLTRTRAPLHTRAKLDQAVRQGREQLAAELSRAYAPLTVPAEQALEIARWERGEGPPPEGDALLELARRLDDLCRRGPLSRTELQAVRALARRADEARELPGWRLLFRRLETVRSRLVRTPPVRPLYASLESAGARPKRPGTLESLLEDGGA
jgi:hypothetical protein